MAQLRPPPIGEYTPQVSAEESLGRVRAPQLSGVSVGPELTELGAATQRLAVSQAANFTMNALSQAQGQWTEQLRKAQETAAPGAPGFTPAFMGQYGKYVDETLKAAPNDLARRMLTQHLTEFGNHLQQQAIGFETQSHVQHSIDSANLSIQTAGNELINDPSVFENRLFERQHLIDNLLIPPDAKDKLQLAARQQLAHYATLGAIQRDPYSAEMELASSQPQNSYTAMLSPDQRVALHNEATRVLQERAADSTRLDNLAVRAHKEQAEEIVKQGVLLGEQPGRLTVGWVNQHAALLDHEQVDYLLKKAQGREEVTHSNPQVYGDLVLSKARNENVNDKAYAALLRGDLTTADFSKVVEKDTQPDWYKRGVQYISTMSGYSELNPNIETAQTKARMVDSWDDWAAAHPTASMKEAQAAYQDLVANAMLIKRTGLPPLRYRVGSDMAPDLSATYKAMVKARDAGELSPEDFTRENQKLLMYQRAHTAGNPNGPSPSSSSSAAQ